MAAAGAGRAVGADEQAEQDLRQAEEDLRQVEQDLHQAEEESAYRCAPALSFDEVIDPRDTRNAILTALEVSARRRGQPCEPKARTGITP